MKRTSVAGMAALAASGVAHAQFGLQSPESPIAQQIYDLHSLIFGICVVVFIAVFSVMFYSIFYHRKSLGAKPASFHENTTVEVIWTIVPFVILVGMAVPATRTVLAMKDTSDAEMTIKVTGYQWKWGYDYLKGDGEGISFYSNLATPYAQIHNEAPKGPEYLLEVDNPLVVPAGKKIRVLTTANDVIHSFWVGALGFKQDAIPGFVRDTWFYAKNSGIYRGQCVELCGKDHGFMPIVIHVMEDGDYKQWVAAKKKEIEASRIDPNKTYTLTELKAQGEKVYQGNCAACHQASGMGVPGAFPALSGSKVATGPVADQIKLVLNGKQGTAMASFKQLSDIEIAAVVTYERNSWANQTGDVVQAADVKALRGGTVALK
ncbi:MAG: cytochrome c oxidase subunit II [Betaproteobacteria bacterium]|nr:cytochrome c oxidase subunit II [Betaproteobacteria bacterium]